MTLAGPGDHEPVFGDALTPQEHAVHVHLVSLKCHRVKMFMRQIVKAPSYLLALEKDTGRVTESQIFTPARRHFVYGSLCKVFETMVFGLDHLAGPVKFWEKEEWLRG